MSLTLEIKFLKNYDGQILIDTYSESSRRKTVFVIPLWGESWFNFMAKKAYEIGAIYLAKNKFGHLLYDLPEDSTKRYFVVGDVNKSMHASKFLKWLCDEQLIDHDSAMDIINEQMKEKLKI